MTAVVEPLGTRVDVTYAGERLENFWDAKEGIWGSSARFPSR